MTIRPHAKPKRQVKEIQAQKYGRNGISGSRPREISTHEVKRDRTSLFRHVDKTRLESGSDKRRASDAVGVCDMLTLRQRTDLPRRSIANIAEEEDLAGTGRCRTTRPQKISISQVTSSQTSVCSARVTGRRKAVGNDTIRKRPSRWRRSPRKIRGRRVQEGAFHGRFIRFLSRTLHYINPPDSSTTPRLTKTRNFHCGRNERISSRDPKSMCSHRDNSSNIFKMTTKNVGGRKTAVWPTRYWTVVD